MWQLSGRFPPPQVSLLLLPVVVVTTVFVVMVVVVVAVYVLTDFIELILLSLYSLSYVPTEVSAQLA